MGVVAFVNGLLFRVGQGGRGIRCWLLRPLKCISYPVLDVSCHYPDATEIGVKAIPGQVYLRVMMDFGVVNDFDVFLVVFHVQQEVVNFK